MLTTADILKRVRRIDIKTRKLSNHLFAGEYHSHFKGQGISFSEVREYTPGDDVKAIDWNVTARMRSPYVKVFEEEREMTVMLVADISASSAFGTKGRTKGELMAEIAAVIGFSAMLNGDKTGLLLFGETPGVYLPPQKGRRYLLRIIRTLLAASYNDTPGVTNVAAALEYLSRIHRRRAIVFLLSDFISMPYERALRAAARRHDLVGIHLYDPADSTLPDAGIIPVRDAERGGVSWIDSSNKRVRQAYADAFAKNGAERLAIFRQSGAGQISVATDSDYVPALHKFFLSR